MNKAQELLKLTDLNESVYPSDVERDKDRYEVVYNKVIRAGKGKIVILGTVSKTPYSHGKYHWYFTVSTYGATSSNISSSGANLNDGEESSFEDAVKEAEKFGKSISF